jgi:hypothetical protein
LLESETRKIAVSNLFIGGSIKVKSRKNRASVFYRGFCNINDTIMMATPRAAIMMCAP